MNFPVVTTWMTFDGTELREISQRESTIVLFHLYLETKETKSVVTNSHLAAGNRGTEKQMEIVKGYKLSTYRINTFGGSHIQLSDYSQQ